MAVLYCVCFCTKAVVEVVGVRRKRKCIFSPFTTISLLHIQHFGEPCFLPTILWMSIAAALLLSESLVLRIKHG